MNDLISVVVPVYNVEDYLHRCVDSILNQSYRNIEIILVNDGSPDSCGAICDDYLKIDERIKVIHKENGGLSDARNRGIEISKGEYITFIDSDDWVHQEYIERLYKLLTSTKSEISICNFISTSKEDIQLDLSKEDIYECSNIEALGWLTDKYYGQMVVAWGKLYKRSLFQNIKFPIGRIHEDEFTTYKLIYEAKKISLTTSPLLYYWKREDSIIGSGFNIKHKLDIIDAFTEKAYFFKEVGLKQLSDKNYKTLFFIFLRNKKQIKKSKSAIYNKEYVDRFKLLKKNLRTSTQDVRFKVFYEMYFISPNTIDFAYEIYKKVKN